MTLQQEFSKIRARHRRYRARTQLTLGSLIDLLEILAPKTPVPALVEPHSYRGYYSDLAFERGDGTRTAEFLLADCLRVLGRKLPGYKGGKFRMGRNTPLWLANHGQCGPRIMDFGKDGITTVDED